VGVYYRAVAAERSDHVVQAGRAPTGRTRWGARLGAAAAGAAVALAFPQWPVVVGVRGPCAYDVIVRVQTEDVDALGELVVSRIHLVAA
jgi:hypothetical protein